MLVKINNRGSGGGRGPTEYLTGNKDHAGVERAVQPEVLRGDTQLTRELIDSLDFAQRYTSGSLNFSESNIPDTQKQAIMDSWERCLFPGMSTDQYSVLWVEHRDKGRLELNFVIPNVELGTGKRLQPYYDAADRPRVDAWQTLVNDQYSLSDPHDPERARTLNTAHNLPKDRKEAAQKITEGLIALSPENRSQVISALSDAGFEVSRQTKKSISIADPEGGRPLRLSGGIYEQSYRGGEQLCQERERAAREYREGREARVREAEERYSRGIERRSADLHKRYPARAVEDRSMETVAMDSISRRDALRNDHHSMDNSMATDRGQLRDRGCPEEPSGSMGVLPQNADKQKSQLVFDQGEINHDDRTRDSITERIRETERSAERIKQSCDEPTRTDRSISRISRALQSFNRHCDTVIQSCRSVAERVSEYVREQRQERSRGHDRGMSL